MRVTDFIAECANGFLGGVAHFTTFLAGVICAGRARHAFVALVRP